MKRGFTAAVTRMFGTFILILLVGCTVTPFIPALPLRQGGRGEPGMEEVPAPTPPPEPPGQPEGLVLHGSSPFLWPRDEV